jgi:xanthine dehydrogenase iron-sulfur cluster and FAD-binding subunit A
MAMKTTLTVNGKQASDDIEPRMLLADYLRERRNLTGTHIGCEAGVCGACSPCLSDLRGRVRRPQRPHDRRLRRRSDHGRAA